MGIGLAGPLFKRKVKMGWAGGSEVADEIWKSIRKDIPEDKRIPALAKIIDVLRDHDWDCVEEIENEDWPESGPAIKMALKRGFKRNKV